MRLVAIHKALLALGLLGALFVAPSCSDGPAISGATGSGSGQGKGQTAGGKGSNPDKDGGSDDVGDLATDAGGDEEGGGGGAGAKKVYPTFRFNGKGNSICGSMNHVTTINVETAYTADTMVVKKTNSRVYCEKSISGSDGVPDDECNKVANSQQSMDKRNQETTYVRLKDDSLQKAKQDGLDYVPYAVFSQEIRAANGRVIKLSKPLPVGIMPGPAGRYKDAETKSWTANANDGTLSFDVTVQISKVSADDSTAQMRITSVISQASADFTLYESWPMPAGATYTIDVKEQSITQIAAEGRNGDGGQKRCTKTDTSTTILTLCDRIVEGQTKAGACQFGQNALN